MLSTKLLSELNQQITYEFYSSHLYLAMSGKFAALDFMGAATWMRTQAEEERVHALKIMDFIIEAGGELTITGFDNPEVKGKDLISIFQAALDHEHFVTDRINLLMSLAIEDKNYAAVNFLNWFVDEQVEEESNAEAIIKSLRLIGKDGNGLYQMDKELGARVSLTPAPAAKA